MTQKLRWCFIILIDLFLILSLNSCQQLDSVSKPHGAAAKEEISLTNKWQKMLATDIDSLQVGDTKGKKGTINVVSFHPQGQTRKIDAVDEINISFSQPVAALAKIDKNAPSLIETVPALKGEGYWKSSTIYTFRIDEKLKRSSKYSIHFRGYTSFSGKKAPARNWTFTTPTIKIQRSQPYNKSKWQTLDQKVLVQFDQDVDPEKIKRYLLLVTPQGNHEIDVRYSDAKERKSLYWNADKDKNLKRYITISPAADLPQATDIRVRFLRDLPSTQGNIGLIGERYILFRTYEHFKLNAVKDTFKPDYGMTINFSNPVQVKHLRESIVIEPAVEIEKSGSWHTQSVEVTGEFQPGVTYTVTIPANLTDRYGNKLGQKKTFTTTCMDYSPVFAPPYQNHFVFESYLDKKVPITVRNIFDSPVYYKQMDIPDILKVFSKGYPRPAEIKENTTNRFQWKIPVKKNRNFTLGFDLEQINIKDPGYYYIKFSGQPKYNRPGQLFQLTDIAMVAKYSPSQVLLVPFNMQTGQLVTGLNFKIKGVKNGLLSDEFSAGANGIAIYEPPIDLIRKNNLFDTLIFSNPKKSFIWGRKYDMVDMWEFQYRSNLSSHYNPRYYYNNLFTFTDKYLYKGGQTVKFKGTLRQILAGEMIIPSIRNIRVEVFNSRNRSIKTFFIEPDTVTNYGSFAGEFVLPADAPTGFYRIRTLIKLDNSSVTKDTTFSLQEYKPAKFETKVTLDHSSIIAGQPLSGKINGRYLFGTPMKQAVGRSTWTVQSTSFTPPGWDRYLFGTHDSSRKQTIYKKDFTLDNGGNFVFKKEALTIAGKNSARLTVHGEIKDKDNNRISGSRSLTVHRGQFYTGLKTGAYFFKQNKPGKIQVVTVSPKGKPVKDTKLELKILREEWKSFQKKDASGALRWEWKKLSEDIVNEPITLPKGNFEKEYTFAKPGYYKVFLTGKDQLSNTVTTTGFFYVTGSGYVSWGVNEGRIIDLVTDKKKYKPGDNVELLIKSPFQSAIALITVEREKVMWHKTITLKGDASTVNIPVNKEFMPNAFVNVLILKERTGLKFDEEGKDIGKPEFYMGYKELTVDASAKKLQVMVSAAKKSFEPGDEVTLDIKVTDKNQKPVQAEVCLSVVDKGVLNLAGYQLPDPFTFFWRKRRLGVKTISTLTDVLGRRLFKEKGENPGGDGGGSAYGSVIVRKNFKESAYYTAFLETGADGTAKVSFKLPENLTTFKAMAVAGTDNHKFGMGHKDLLVKKTIILKPAVPNFSRPGDSFSAGVTVTNNADKKLKVKVRVSSKDTNLEQVRGDKSLKKITLAPGDTMPVWFRFKVKGMGVGQLTFKASGGAFSDGLLQEIPMRLPQFSEATAHFGRVEDADVREQVVVPENTLRQKDRLEVTLASSAVVGVKRNFDLLQEYPYECLEQRLSKQYPLLGAGDFLLAYGLLKLSPEEIMNRVGKLVKMIPKYQAGDGGFKYWPDSSLSSPYLSCYTVEFMLDAKQKRYDVDVRSLKRALNYLKKVARGTVDSKYPYSKNVGLLVQCYAVSLLSRENIFMGAAINNLFEVRDRVPFSGIAYLVKALDGKHKLPPYMQPVLTKTMLNKMKDEPTMTHFQNHEGDSWWWVHESNIKTTAIVLDTLLEVYGRFPYAEKIARWLTRTTAQKRFLSTQENIFLFKAFEHYYRVFEKETPDFVAEVLLNGNSRIKETFSGRQMTARTQAMPLSAYKPGQTIDTVFRKQGSGMLYYLLRLKYYLIGDVPALNRGFSVTKTYKRMDNTPVTNNRFKAGEKYIVEVAVETKMERPFVMLDDPLPGGLRVLNPDFKTGSQLDAAKSSGDSRWKGYWGNFYRSEIYFDRVQVFADFLKRGTHKWTYLVIATNAGTYTVPNTMVSEMYNPEVFGRSANLKLMVE